MTQPIEPLRVFLSYSHTDIASARKLYRYLREKGLDVWFEEENLTPGQEWKLEIEKGLEYSDIVLVCLSKTSIKEEGFIQTEFKFALERAFQMPEQSIFLIPVRLDKCKVPTRLARYKEVDLTGHEGYNRLMRSLKQRADQLGRADVEKSQPVSGVDPRPPIPSTRKDGEGNIIVGRNNDVEVIAAIPMQAKDERTAQTIEEERLITNKMITRGSKIRFQFLDIKMFSNSINDPVLVVTNSYTEDLINLKFRIDTSENLSSDIHSFTISALTKGDVKEIPIRLHCEEMGQAQLRIWQISARSARTGRNFYEDDVFIPLVISNETKIQDEDILIQVSKRELIKGECLNLPIKIYNNSGLIFQNVHCQLSSEQISFSLSSYDLGVLEAGREILLSTEITPKEIGQADVLIQLTGVVKNTAFKRKYGFALYSEEVDNH